MKLVLAAIAGALFAIGLLISDMTSPGRIVAFLDVGTAWDPTLMFVMAGAIGVYAPVAWIARKRPRPLFARAFHWPEATTIDLPLLGGAMIFGVGWGLSGFCPGPALVAAGTGRIDTLVFVATMIAGIVALRLVRR
ncbi:MAG: YeeE/YedE family protein [Deltaproteobacteria bacterium]|nr:YeeE/YedE family protein [Deltaproteobacteria bacterium]